MMGSSMDGVLFVMQHCQMVVFDVDSRFISQREAPYYRCLSACSTKG